MGKRTEIFLSCFHPNQLASPPRLQPSLGLSDITSSPSNLGGNSCLMLLIRVPRCSLLVPLILYTINNLFLTFSSETLLALPAGTLTNVDTTCSPTQCFVSSP
jgi:hypothetical protein